MADGWTRRKIFHSHHLPTERIDRTMSSNIRQLLRAVDEAKRSPDGDGGIHLIECMCALEREYARVGLLNESLAMCKEILDTKIRLLGPDDPTILAAMNNLGSAYVQVCCGTGSTGSGPCVR